MLFMLHTLSVKKCKAFFEELDVLRCSHCLFLKSVAIDNDFILIVGCLIEVNVKR